MNPKFYIVGGWVRDLYMGLSPKDRDWVVVGATPEYMLSKGYKKVGSDFPVFLHPKTGEEYALARKERKISKGYHGFEVDFGPEITLEEDLFRRDITINSMALDENYEYIDPFNGMKDIDNKIIRHVSKHFAEDPVRVLRVARFKSRWPEFEIHSDTYKLMKEIVQNEF